jgi:putative tryptophan/tyrosine transport system substrate-binding protein
MRRRDFIALLGGAAAWPLAVRAQPAARPILGFIHGASLDGIADQLRAFREGLKEAGYVEGGNVAIDYRAADNRIDRLPELIADLLRQRVTVIAATDNASAAAAKAATSTIPVVFVVGSDPVSLGLVASLARPPGNLTGVNFFSSELVGKRLQLLRDLVPGATRVAILVNPADHAVTEATLRDAQAASRAMDMQIRPLEASSSREIDAAFATFVSDRPDALSVAQSPFFTSRRVQLTHLATRYRIPAIYATRQAAETGGLMSYGASLTDAFHQIGVYAGRILMGAKPADLPVVQSTKFELVINAQIARIQGLTVPEKLLIAADDVIE